MKSQTSSTLGKKSDRLNGVRVAYGTKLKAVYPNTGMRTTDRGELDENDVVKIASRIKRFDKFFNSTVQIIAFLIVIAFIIALLAYYII